MRVPSSLGSIQARRTSRSEPARSASRPTPRCRRAGRDLAREVPGQDHDHVGSGLRDPLGRVDRDVRARSEPPVLVRVAVDRVVEEVGPDPAVVEQRVPLPGRAVADDLLAVAAQLDQQLEQRTLRLAAPARRTAGSTPGRGAPPPPRGARSSPTASVGSRGSSSRGRRRREASRRASAAPRRRSRRARARRRSSAMVKSEKYEKCSW